MKSKISFFNKTIFMKNVTLYWPIWGVYTVIAVVMQSGAVWLCNNWGYYADGYNDNRQFRDLMDCLQFGGFVWLIAFGALIAGMALYSYMYNNKSANMIHALPVDRTQLYGTTLISGVAFLVGPLFVTAVLTSLMCLIYTIPGIGYVWLWFICVAAIAIAAFAVVSICALFTGHIIVLPMYVIAVNLLSWLVYFLLNTIVTTFGFGVTELGENAEHLAGVFCPVQCFSENLEWIYNFSDTGLLESASLTGWGYIILYLVMAAVAYIAAYVIYRKRKIEQAGDFLTVNWVKPIFRGVVGLFGAMYGAMILRGILMDTSIGCSTPLFVVLMLVSGITFYFSADMFIKKSFHVFKKSNWIKCGIFSVIVLLAFFGMYGLADKYEKDIPELSDIELAEIRLSYDITLYGEDAKAILEIQKDILEQADYMEERLANGERNYDVVSISYELNNGERISRRYCLWLESENIQSIYKKIVALEENKENYLVNTFGKDYANVKTFYGGGVEGYFIHPEDRDKIDGYPNGGYESRYLDEMQAKELYYAIIADIKAGTLMKYNIYDGKFLKPESSDTGYYVTSEVHIYIQYKIPVENNEVVSEDNLATAGAYVEDSDYQKERNVYLAFGPDCENIINKLIELELIESVEHLWWGAAEELLETPTN